MKTLVNVYIKYLTYLALKKPVSLPILMNWNY